MKNLEFCCLKVRVCFEFRVSNFEFIEALGSSIPPDPPRDPCYQEG